MKIGWGSIATTEATTTTPTTEVINARLNYAEHDFLTTENLAY
jgi:hypothetical protein